MIESKMRPPPSYAEIRDGAEMEETIEPPKKSAKLQSEWRVLLSGESEANSDVFSQSQILSLSFTSRKMNSDSMPINSKHVRLVSSISASHRRSASSPVFPSPNSPLLASSPQFFPDLAPSPKCDGDETVPTSSSEIVEDHPSQWERRSRSLRSTSLQDLFEAESRNRDQSSIEYENNFFYRNLSGFSNSALHSDSTTPRHQTTLGELLISEAKDHSQIQSSHKRIISVCNWKAKIRVLQSKWKRILSIVFRKHSTPGSRTQLNLPSSDQTTMSKADTQQAIVNRWFMKSPRSKPPIQSSANWWLGSGSSPSRFSRQLSTASSAHELYYLSRRTQIDRLRKRTFLPYREQLISFFSCIRS